MKSGFSKPDRSAGQLDSVRVLQCLSTFFVPGAFLLSFVAYRMISDFTGLSLPRTVEIVRHLDRKGYLTVAAAGESARLDPDRWEAESRHCSLKRYFAHFVAKSPVCLRDEDAQLPASPCCAYIQRPDRFTGCSVTVASYFDGVYNTYANRESCCPARPPSPIEVLFEPRLCVCDHESVMSNMWFLQSAFYPSALVLFRQQLLRLYLTGVEGKSGADLVENSCFVLLCINDDAIGDEEAADLISVESPCHSGECVQVFTTLSGHKVTLDAAYGIAHYGKGVSECPRLYRERGTVGPTRIVELGAAGSGASQPRHDPYCALQLCDSPA